MEPLAVAVVRDDEYTATTCSRLQIINGKLVSERLLKFGDSPSFPAVLNLDGDLALRRSRRNNHIWLIAPRDLSLAMGVVSAT